MNDGLEQKEFYYPSGKLEAERSFKEGIPHGYHREWHENGSLASEVRYNNGVPEGVGKQWDRSGNLIFSYSIYNGTGIQKAWFPDQGIWAEISWLYGKMTGRQRTYMINDGTVIGDTFWIENKSVSRKSYSKACETNPNLPRYEKDSDKPRKKHIPKPSTIAFMSDKDSIDDFTSDLLASESAHEALSWLTERGAPERSLGEAQGKESSISLVESLYKKGAKSVWVLDIDDSLDEEQNSGRLLIELPKNRIERYKLLAKCAEIGVENGFDPEPDTGQEYTLLMLD